MPSNGSGRRASVTNPYSTGGYATFFDEWTSMQEAASAAPAAPSFTRTGQLRGYDQSLFEEPVMEEPRVMRASAIRAVSDSFISGNVHREENSEMSTVAQYFGRRASYPTIEKHPLIVGTYLAGVEIELENMNVGTPSFNYWDAKDDGSLRNNGKEFVFSSPWGGRDLYNAAIEIDGFLFDNHPEETWRCSTHVHIDVRDMNVAQVKKMILAYAMYERILFQCSGAHRYKNNFCVALGFAQEQLNTLGNAWSENSDQFFSRITEGWDKYSAMNLLPMSSFGSIEFRISEAKWRKGRLIRLVNRFLSLKEIAMNFTGTEEEMLEYMLTTPIQKVIRKGLPRVMPDVTKDVEYGFKIAHDIISLNKIRARHIKYLHPNLEDGTRVIDATIFEPGWSHLFGGITGHRLNSANPVRMEARQPAQMTFGFLRELQGYARERRCQFDLDWFLPEQNRAQLRSLYSSFCAAQEQGREDEDDEPEVDNNPEFW